MPDSSTTPPDDRHDLPGDETTPVQARKDTLAGSGGSDFRHGRFEPGERLGSRYRIVARLGEGGMGEVYRADDLELGQSVALKFLPQRVAADESWLRRFRNEVRIARQIAHPNVCRIYDIGQEDGQVFLSMEYIDGEDLSSVLRRLGRPSREKAIEIARQICLGLAAAHESNVLHRDLKPANIMIDGRGRVRITDFGLAGFLDELEGVEARAGTPAYMAPEQLARGEVSVRSDVYTLGLILHELFTGKCAFDTNDIDELKRRHTSGSLHTPSSLTDDIDPAVERVIMQCLHEHPAKRPQSVYQVLAALPGGDPLAAALAAGELPAPEMVANARDAGGLRPVVAIGLLVAVLAAFAMTYLINAGTLVMPEKSPTELAVIAGQVMEELGYVDLPGNSITGYDVNAQLADSLRSSPRRASDLSASEWPPRFRFWRRWTRGAFSAVDFHNPEVFRIDGPTTDPGDTATVAVDSTGRLLGLLVESPSLVDTSTPEGDIDWSPVFRRAHLDQADATSVPPLKQPPVYCDDLAAWQLKASGGTGDPVTFQMGAVGGRPNYFEFLGLDQEMPSSRDQSSITTVRMNNTAFMVIRVCMIFLALRNLLSSRGDRRNAMRSALIIGGLYTILEALSIRPGNPISDLLGGRSGGHIAMHALMIWVTYMAIEPYVRRVWPRMLVGLVRALSGRLRDPAVGREILLGTVVGSGLVVVLAMTTTAVWRWQVKDAGQLPYWAELWSRMSPIQFLSMNVHRVAWTAWDAAKIATVLIAIRLLVRNTAATVVVNIGILGFMSYSWTMNYGSGSTWPALAYATVFAVAIVLLFTQVGILAAFIAMFVLRPEGLYTTELSAWYTPYGVAELVIVLVLAFYGFWVSLAGQPIFKDMLAEPQVAA